MLCLCDQVNQASVVDLHLSESKNIKFTEVRSNCVQFVSKLKFDHPAFLLACSNQSISCFLKISQFLSLIKNQVV